MLTLRQIRYPLWTLLLLGSVSGAIAAELTADEIMNRNFEVTKVKTLTSTATMVLTNERGQTRERKTTSWSSLQENGVDQNLVVRFEHPADVRGTSFLQLQHSERDDDMWIYLPALHKSRRLVSSNKHDSFVGTDFSYADVLPLKPSEFSHKLLRSEKTDGHDCYVVESIPKNDGLKRDLGYVKSVSWVRKDNLLGIKMDYYDIDGKLWKTQTASDPKLVDPENKRWLPLKREMVNRRTGHRTTITLDKIDTKTPIPARAFTVQAIERK